MSRLLNTRYTKTICAAAVAAVTTSLALSLASSPAHAQQSFWDNQDEGWFFYEPDPVPEEEPEEKPPEVKPVVIPPPDSKKPEEPPEPEEPAYLSAQWLKENLPRYHRAALDNPTDVETVAVYAYLKRVALDKAEQFTRTYQDALLKYPVLDENTNRSTASFASKALDDAAKEASARLLRTIGERTLGLFFFYEEDCAACIDQTRPLDWVRRKSGFDVQPISLDGSPLPVTGFENYVVDEGQSDMLGIVTTPAIYLVIDSKTIVSVGQGGIAADDLAEAVIDQARMNNVISDAEFQETQNSKMNPLGQSFEQMLKAKPTQPDERGYIEPNDMFELIKGEISG
ncbi:conjugal transfer protein TraF [Halomonas sp. I5-271120]|uniref:conjugal transfer protein TraF n=1 Tax=Halomonas sp. I5-271120 TaxID=3061632 RepID=UPI0027147AD9|nr:conjugal transfer protein TraF [Halomonas sp. I5-271120]